MSSARQLVLSAIFAVGCVVTVSPTSVAGRDLQKSHSRSTEAIYSKLLANADRDKATLNLFANLIPKGADLHHHFSGAIYAENYLQWAKEHGFCIYHEDDRGNGIVKYHVVEKPSELSDKQKKACLSTEQVLADNQFYRDLLKNWSLKDYANHYHLQSPPDKQFFDTFRFFTVISKASYQIGLQKLKEQAVAENVNYIETMLSSAPAVDIPALSQELNGMSAKGRGEDVKTILNRAYEQLSASPSAQAAILSYIKETEAAVAGVDDQQFRVRTLAYVNRNSPPSTVFNGLYTAFLAAEKSPLIVGVNIVGPENYEVAMRDYDLHMQMFAFLKTKHPRVKLSLHAGELTLGMVPPEGLNFHIHDAVMTAGATRIGHGVDLPYEKNSLSLIRHMARQKIAVEINLTSNQEILGVGGSNHPLHVYRRFDVPYVISTDDAGVSRSSLSQEYFLYITQFKPSYKQLKQTIYRSIHYSFLSDADKKDEINRLDRKFQEFEGLVTRSITPP